MIREKSEGERSESLGVLEDSKIWKEGGSETGGKAVGRVTTAELHLCKGASTVADATRVTKRSERSTSPSRSAAWPASV